MAGITSRGIRVLRCPLLLALVCLCTALPAAGAPPTNDNFQNASPITGSSATIRASTVEATKEPGEPDHAGNPGGHSLWWRFTAPASGGVTLDTCGTDTSIVIDTLLAVYTGTGVSSLAPVKSNDNSVHPDLCSTIGSSLTFIATKGQVYSIAVDGKDGETGDVKLLLQPTLTLDVKTVSRRRAVDATRFAIDVAAFRDGIAEIPEEPRLTLRRGGSSTRAELEPVGESETSFRHVFEWFCERHGRWSWTVSVRRDGQTVSESGSFVIPGCTRQRWYVSQGKVVADFARDVGSADARFLRCGAVGPRRGPLAHTWSCRMVRPGWACTGTLLFRYTRVLQRGDVVESGRQASGRIVCRR